MVKYIFIKSPDEWATTKQACRDKRVVRLNLFNYLIYTYIYIYVCVCIYIYIHNQQNIIVFKASFYIQQLYVYAASRNDTYSTSRKLYKC